MYHITELSITLPNEAYDPLSHYIQHIPLLSNVRRNAESMLSNYIITFVVIHTSTHSNTLPHTFTREMCVKPQAEIIYHCEMLRVFSEGFNLYVCKYIIQNLGTGEMGCIRDVPDILRLIKFHEYYI